MSHAGNPVTPLILLIEDNPGDVLLVRESLREHGVRSELLVLSDGEKALHFVENLEEDKSAVCPSLVVLDLNLPKRNGHDVLKKMRQGVRCRHTPVIVLSSSDAASDRRGAAEMQVWRYIRKPSTLDEFMTIGAEIKQVLQPNS